MFYSMEIFNEEKKTYRGDTTLPDLHFVDKKKTKCLWETILACVSITCRDYLITYGDLGQKYSH